MTGAPWSRELIAKARRLRRSRVALDDAVLSMNKPRGEVQEAYWATLRHEDDGAALLHLSDVLLAQAAKMPLVNGKPYRQVER